MPRIDLEEDQDFVRVLGGRPLDERPVLDKFEEDGPGFIDVLGDAFSLENEVASGINSFNRELERKALGTEYDPDFDPVIKAETLGLDIDLIEELSLSPNQKIFDFTLAEVQKERDARSRLEAAGGSGIAAEVVAGVISPFSLLSIGGAAYKIGKGGISLGRAALIAGGAGATEAVISEGILQSTQFERTATESIAAIGGSALLAGLLGTGAGAIINKKLTGSAFGFDETAKRLENDFSADVKEDIVFDGSAAHQLAEFNAAGAAPAPKLTKDQQDLFTNRATRGLIKATKKLSPAVRAATSKLQSVQDIAEKLVEFTTIRNKNLEGIASEQSVETRLNTYRGMLANGIEQGNGIYKAYQKGLGRKAAVDVDEFHTLVSMAMRRGDKADALGVDSVTQKAIEETAEAYRENLYRPMKALFEGDDVRLLPKDVTPETAISYINRVYNNEKIRSKEFEFKDRVKLWARDEVEKELKISKEVLARQGAKAVEKKLAKEKISLIDIEGMDGYINSVADDIFNKLTKMDHTVDFRFIESATRGPLKERTFTIPDELIEDFLENDVRVLSQRFARIGGAEYELNKTFGTAKFEDIAGTITDNRTELAKTIENDFNQRIADADPQDKPKLVKQKEKELRLLAEEAEESRKMLEALWDKVRGTYGSTSGDPNSAWVRGLAATRTLNYITTLGGVTLSSIPDIAMPIYVHGIGKVSKGALAPMVKSFAGGKAFGLQKQAARRMGIAVETILNTRLQALFSVGDQYVKGSGMEKMLDNIGQSFGKYTGLNYWNDTMKTVSFMTSQQRMADNILSGKLSKKESTWMSSLGINEVDMRAMAREMEKHGEVMDGVQLMNEHMWDNPAMARKLATALNADVNRTIVTKGAGDVPIMADTAEGKTLMQFMSFGFASNQRVLMSGLQRQDGEVLQGLIGLATMGMFVYAMKQLSNGKELSDDPAVWLQEGVDRSGIASLPFWANNTFLEPAGLGLSNLTGEVPSRMAANYGLANVIGPTGGRIVDTFKTGRMMRDLAVEGQAAESDIKGFRRMVPYQNLFGVKALFDEAEKGLVNILGE